MAMNGVGVGAAYNPRTVEEVFRDFKGRRTGVFSSISAQLASALRFRNTQKPNWQVSRAHTVTYIQKKGIEVKDELTNCHGFVTYSEKAEYSDKR